MERREEEKTEGEKEEEEKDICRLRQGLSPGQRLRSEIKTLSRLKHTGETLQVTGFTHSCEPSSCRSELEEK